MIDPLYNPCRTWRGKHRFKPRYDRVETERKEQLEYGDIHGQAAVMMVTEAIKIASAPLVSFTYRGDVCVHCGACVNNPSKE